jgi:hypothetical protein
VDELAATGCCFSRGVLHFLTEHAKGTSSHQHGMLLQPPNTFSVSASH